MSTPKIYALPYVSVIVAIFFLSSCATAPTAQEEKRPIEIAKTRYKDQIIPVFDALTVKSDRSVPPVYPPAQKRAGIEGVGVVLIIVDETGKAVEFGIVGSVPGPEFGLAALTAAKRWRYFPMFDSSGRPILHALRMPVMFRISNY